MPRKRKHAQTDTLIQDMLRAELRGREAQRTETQTAADTKYVRSFLYWIFHLPPSAVLKGSYGALQIRGPYDPDQSIQWKTEEIELRVSELYDLAKAINRLGIK
jgi:hypothetical protein